MKAPIILFVYNRPGHTRRVVESLQGNREAEESRLIVYSDGPKENEDPSRVIEVRTYIKNVEGFHDLEVRERGKNLGLAPSIITGVTEVVDHYGKVIVVEDDLVASPYFLRYMNDGLDYYRDEEKVISVHGYSYPVHGLPETYFLRGADCWGWGTWGKGWQHFEADGEKLLTDLEQRGLIKEFDFNGAYLFSHMLRDQIAGKVDSWAIRWHASAFLKGKLTLYPGLSLVRNIGLDKSGVHCGKEDAYLTDLSGKGVELGHIRVEEDREVRKKIEAFFRGQKNLSFSQRVKKNIKRFLKN